MKDSRILSSFQELAHAAGARPIAEMPEHLRVRVQVFDTCQVGTVLRAVLFVQAIVAVAALFGAHTFVAWVTQMAIFTGAALPAVLAWLLCVCGLKRQLGLLPLRADELLLRRLQPRQRPRHAHALCFEINQKRINGAHRFVFFC